MPPAKPGCLLPGHTSPQSCALGLTGIGDPSRQYAKLEAVAAHKQTQRLFSQVYKGATSSSRRTGQPAGAIYSSKLPHLCYFKKHYFICCYFTFSADIPYFFQVIPCMHSYRCFSWCSQAQARRWVWYLALSVTTAT